MVANSVLELPEAKIVKCELGSISPLVKVHLVGEFRLSLKEYPVKSILESASL